MRTTLFLIVLLGGCGRCHPPAAPADMARPDAAAADMAKPDAAVSCLPPGAPCDPLRPPPCCDGITCADNGRCP